MSEPVPPFWKRLLVLPFNPGLMAQARDWPPGAVLGPMVTLVVLLGAGLGLFRGLELTMKLKEGGVAFDAMADPIVIDRGGLRVEGTRLFRYEEGDMLFLVDPEQTVPDQLLPHRFIVARRHVVVDNKDGKRRETKWSDALSLLGQDSLRIDGASVTAFTAKWSTSIALGMMGFLTLFELIGFLFTLLYAFLSGLVLGGLWGKSRGVSGTATFCVALAALAGKPVINLVLSLLGTSVGACAGVLVWPAMALLLGSYVLSRLPVAPSSAPGA
ncbi:MAG: hypothetical protein Q8L48_38540 [Archangium sp.]|nr:hypothetical protein [Archangium sp.]